MSHIMSHVVSHTMSIKFVVQTTIVIKKLYNND